MVMVLLQMVSGVTLRVDLLANLLHCTQGHLMYMLTFGLRSLVSLMVLKATVIVVTTGLVVTFTPANLTLKLPCLWLAAVLA